MHQRITFKSQANLVLSTLFFALSICACYSPASRLSAEDTYSGSSRPSGVQQMAVDEIPSIPDLAAGRTVPPTAEEYQEQFSQAGRRWLYGPGIGKTMANVGTIIVFPPYALYLLGNAGLTLAGQEPLRITNAIPQTPRKYVLTAYEGVTNVPGRIAAALAQEEFQAKRKQQ